MHLVQTFLSQNKKDFLKASKVFSINGLAGLMKVYNGKDMQDLIHQS